MVGVDEFRVGVVVVGEAAQLRRRRRLLLPAEQPLQFRTLRVEIFVFVFVVVVRTNPGFGRRLCVIRVHHLDLVSHALPGYFIIRRTRVVLPVVALSLDDAARSGGVAHVVTRLHVLLLGFLLDGSRLLLLLLLFPVVFVVFVARVSRLRLEPVDVVRVGQPVVVVVHRALRHLLEPLRRGRGVPAPSLQTLLRFLQGHHPSVRHRPKVVPLLHRDCAHVRGARLHHEEEEVAEAGALARAVELHPPAFLALADELEVRLAPCHVAPLTAELPLHRGRPARLELWGPLAAEPPDDVLAHGRERAHRVPLAQHQLHLRVVRDGVGVVGVHRAPGLRVHERQLEPGVLPLGVEHLAEIGARGEDRGTDARGRRGRRHGDRRVRRLARELDVHRRHPGRDEAVTCVGGPLARAKVLWRSDSEGTNGCINTCTGC